MPYANLLSTDPGYTLNSLHLHIMTYVCQKLRAVPVSNLFNIVFLENLNFMQFFRN